MSSSYPILFVTAAGTAGASSKSTSKKDKKIAANAKAKREEIKQGRGGQKPAAKKKEVSEKLKPWEAEEEDETWLSGSLSWCAFLKPVSSHFLA
jgi:hypothetical protein